VDQEGQKPMPTDSPVQPLVLKPGEVAERLDVSRSKAYAMIAAGEIPSVEIGGCVRVRLTDLLTYVETRPKRAEGPAAEANEPAPSVAPKVAPRSRVGEIGRRRAGQQTPESRSDRPRS
jgi:excisionase family DNA binding protein